MAQHNTLGQKGEEVAAQYLSGIGFKIIERNWRHEKDEVDIIARDNEFLVFVEVKTRSTFRYGEPDEAVDNKKMRFLIRAAEAYVEKKDLYEEIRYDIVAIVIENNKHTIKHIRDAFYPEAERI